MGDSCSFFFLFFAFIAATPPRSESGDAASDGATLSCMRWGGNGGGNGCDARGACAQRVVAQWQGWERTAT